MTTFHVVQMLHDPDCPAIRSQRASDCTCEPEDTGVNLITDLNAEEAAEVLTSHLKEDADGED